MKGAWGESAILKSLVSLDTPGKATVQVTLSLLTLNSNARLCAGGHIGRSRRTGDLFCR